MRVQFEANTSTLDELDLIISAYNKEVVFLCVNSMQEMCCCANNMQLYEKVD